ncbi:polysaccharide biosynthesis/export family protein [Micromonospora sp. STR1s_5]|nr:polysaccharide biosynthesis/export family protein [Micromonospora sp. STR1s_5]
MLLTFQTSSPSAATAYTLGPGDKIRVQVSEWRPARGEVYEWEPLTGEFMVNDAGSVSLPLLGSVAAGGLSTDQLANAISETLQRKVGLVVRPEASVEILAYRPFYILGSVNKPADYPFRPGMTVLQAVGVAGGFYRPSEWRLEREGITSSGELRVLDLDRAALAAKRARLEAEISGVKEVTFPPALLNSREPTVRQFIRQEQLIFTARLETLRSQTEALDQLKLLLGKEIDSLREKSQVQDRQIALARRELDLVNGLVSRGLTVNARQLTLEQTTAQLESARLDLTVAGVRAQQDLNRANRDILALRSKRNDESASELKETQLKLDSANRRIDTAEALINDTEAEFRSASAPIITIVRGGGESARETPATEATVLEPGDVVRVRVPLRPGRAEQPAPDLRSHQQSAGPRQSRTE